MRVEGWFSGCKVECFKWFEGNKWYFNVQYFAPGTSLCNPPAVDKTVYITDNENGYRIIKNFTDSLVNYVMRLDIKEGQEVVLTF